MIYTLINAEAPKEQNGTYCKFIWQTMAKLWSSFFSNVSKKDEEGFLLFLNAPWGRLVLLDLFDDVTILVG